MKYFPDQPADGLLAKLVVFAVPLLTLAVALIYSAHSPPWGVQVDPESAYAMNGLAAAAGYPFMKNDHPGTTTILLVDLMIRAWTFVAGRSDVIEFGLKNYDAMIYAARAVEALILSGVLAASGVLIRNTTRSSIAAMLFQVGPFVHPDTFHFVTVLIPESLMVSCAIFGMALVVKAALDEKPPTAMLGAASGLTFALGLSSKYLHLPLAIIGISLIRNWRATVAAWVTGIGGFVIFNRIFNPLVFTSGWHWLVSLATHKGVYGEGESGFVDFDVFWPNMAQILSTAPLVSAVFAIGAVVALAQMARSRRYLDPVSLTLIASFLAFAAQLVATSKHFAVHYMMASWVLTGGVLVLTMIEARRLLPRLSPRLLAGAAAVICVGLIATTLFEIRRQAAGEAVVSRFGEKLSKVVTEAGPSCANVSAMFVRAPENELNHGGDMTFGNPEMEQRFSEAYVRAFSVPLLDHNFYRHVLLKNFLVHSYAKLATEYPCIVVRTSKPLDAKTSSGLLELNPEHCVVEFVQIYTVGIPCEKIRRVALGL